MEIFLAVEYDGEGQGYYKTLRAFARREDAEAYDRAEEVVPVQVEDGPVEVRTWYWLTWWPDRPDCSQEDARPLEGIFESPDWCELRREFSGLPVDQVLHEWSQAPNGSGDWGLDVQGWDKDLVEATYQRLRAEYFARQAEDETPDLETVP